ncbi:MAG: tetratricopeptide repeat protein [Pseudomonadota bacterium]
MQLVQTQQFREAKSVCKKVCKQNQNDTEAWFLLGAINGELGDFKEAERCCRRAVKLQPNHAGLHYNLAIALAKQNKLDKSLSSFKQATLLNPQYVEAYLDLGNTLQSLGHIEPAIKNYQHAIRLQPTLLTAHLNLGHLYRSQNRLTDAETCYADALKIQPDSADACKGLADIYISQSKYTEAFKLLEPIINQLPGDAELYIKLAVDLMLQGEHQQSLTCLQKVISLYPNQVEARWAYAILQIPSIYETTDAPDACRSAFSHELSHLESWFKSNSCHGDDYLTIGNHHPFFLAYQEKNNYDLLARHGKLLSQLMAEWSTEQHFSAPVKTKKNLLRIGIISPHLLEHSVWDAIVKGWFQHLNKNQFECHTFHISNIEDAETALVRERSNFYIHGDKNLNQWVELIQNQQIDILLYPEVGMDPTTIKLASLRLAPVQIACWGHPETTGLPTMDYYLSAEDFEPPNAQDYYTEQLISLPHLGCYYHPLSVSAKEPDWTNLDINQDSPLLLCPGMPFKYAPEHDWVFVEIARELGDCQFVFFQHHSLGNLPGKFRKRLQSVFTQAKLNFEDYVKFIPWQKKPDFFGLMKQSTLFMDTIGFSGFNTAMQAIECGLPIVTREGEFMRGRLASGILKRMQLTELIADDEKKYITLIIKMVKDTKYRSYIQQMVKANRHILFDDLEPIRAMEVIFQKLVKNKPYPENK